MFYGGGYSKSALESSIGKEFYSLAVRFKPWPTSAIIHPFIEAALELVENHGVETEAIDRIHIQGGSHIQPWCEPIAERQKPKNAAAAANSVFFAVSKAFVNGKVTLGDFTAEGLQQSEAVHLAQRMSYSIDEGLGPSGIVKVQTKTGQYFVKRVDVPLVIPLSR
jgi:2-methylcitrate dehydratase PrpD